ncbi:hypothetical protein AHAS_Ahas01G0096000 [Arachis hypogaea]
MTWLLTSMETPLKNKILDCEFAYQVWKKIHDYFAKISKIRIQQLKAQLKNIKKEGLSASEYLKKIQKFVDCYWL